MDEDFSIEDYELVEVYPNVYWKVFLDGNNIVSVLDHRFEPVDDKLVDEFINVIEDKLNI